MNLQSDLRRRARLALILSILVCPSFAQSAVNPYNNELQAITDTWGERTHAQRIVELDKLHQLRELVDDPTEIKEQISSVANRTSENKLVRDAANWYLAKIAVQEGRIEEARRIADNLGFVRSWTLLTSGECGQKIRVTTSQILKSSPLGFSTLHNYRTPVCVGTAIYSPAPQTVALRYGTNVPAKLFANGVLISGQRKAASFGFDQNSIGVELASGWTALTFQLDGNGARKQFGLRITGPKGGGIALVCFGSKSATGVAPRTTIVEDLLDVAMQASPTAESLDAVSAIKKIRGIADDQETLQAAVRVSPSANRWLALADACWNQQCLFSAVQNALQIDPGNRKAKIRLAEYFQSHGDVTGAANLLREVVYSEPGDFIAQMHLANLQRRLGSREVSYHSLESLKPQPIWLKRELALAYQSQGQIGKANLLLNQVWKTSFDDDHVRTALTELAWQRADEPALTLLQQTGELLDPMNPQFEPVSKRNASIQENSRDSSFVALQPAPANASRPEIVAAAFDVNPVGLFRSAAIRNSAGSSEEDAGYLVDPVRLAAEALRNVPREDANVVTLADITVERLQSNGQSASRVQQVYYIANARGAHDYANRSIQYSHALQALQLLGARIYKPNGQVVQAEDQGEGPIADPTTSMYYDSRSRGLYFPGLEKGDVIAIEYRLTPNSKVNPFGNYFGALVSFQNGLPQRLHRYVLIAPKDLRLNIVEQRMPVQAKVSDTFGRIVHQWDATNIIPLNLESRAPALTELAPYVSVSTFSDWNQLGRWYAVLITPQFSLDNDLQDALSRIDIVGKSELEKVHAIHEFVLHNTYYVAMEFGVYSYKPYPVSQVYARRFGDCKDKASLMIALMRAEGIDAELALVRTRKMGDVTDRATSIAIFNHAVAYVPKYDLWLDGTAEYAGSRELPLDDQGAMALTVNLNGSAALRRIPVTLPMQNYTHRVVKAAVQKNGEIQFNGSSYTRGEDAPGLRREFEIADRQRDSVRANLAQVYPSVKVDSVQVEGAHDIEHDINVNFSGSLDKFTGNKILGLSSSWLPHKYVDSLAPLSSRRQDLLLPAPWTTEEELHFTIPEGASFDSLPSSLNYETPFGTAVLRYERRGRELVVTTSVQFRKLRISPAEYSAFREFCSTVEKAFRTEIKVQLPS